MNVYEAINKRRSIRRFKEIPIPFEILEKLINAARVAPSAGNVQPLEYLIVDDRRLTEEVFNALEWARYISPEGDPPPGERPVAYVVVLCNTKIKASNYEWDAGAAIENILLSALEEGIGTCWIRSIDRDRLKRILDIPGHIFIDSVVALGYSNEHPMMEEMKDSIKYWKDDSGRLHVPKRRLADILHRNLYSAKKGNY